MSKNKLFLSIALSTFVCAHTNTSFASTEDDIVQESVASKEKYEGAQQSSTKGSFMVACQVLALLVCFLESNYYKYFRYFLSSYIERDDIIFVAFFLKSIVYAFISVLVALAFSQRLSKEEDDKENIKGNVMINAKGYLLSMLIASFIASHCRQAIRYVNPGRYLDPNGYATKKITVISCIFKEWEIERKFSGDFWIFLFEDGGLKYAVTFAIVAVQALLFHPMYLRYSSTTRTVCDKRGRYSSYKDKVPLDGDSGERAEEPTIRPTL